MSPTHQQFQNMFVLYPCHVIFMSCYVHAMSCSCLTHPFSSASVAPHTGTEASERPSEHQYLKSATQMGGYSSCHPGCSRTRAATTHGEQPCTSSTRVQDHLARIHSPCAVCPWPLRRPSTHAPQVPRPPRAERMHGRLQLVPPRLQPHQGRHHAWCASL